MINNRTFCHFKPSFVIIFQCNKFFSADTFTIFYLGGSTLKTTVKQVTVELIDDGHRVMRQYSIATKDGILMTHRLEKLLSGSVIRRHEERLEAHYGEWHDIQFIGMVWQPPYRLLQEISEDRKELQRELFNMAGSSDLTEYPTLTVPMKECNHKISELIKTELDLRKQLKARLRELDDIKTIRDLEALESDFTCPAWLLDSDSEPKPDIAEKPPKLPAPYSW